MMIATYGDTSYSNYYCSCYKTTTDYKQEYKEPKWELQRCYSKKFIKHLKINSQTPKVNLIRLDYSGSVKDKKINKRKRFLRKVKYGEMGNI